MTETLRDLPHTEHPLETARSRRRFLLEASLATALAACGRPEQRGTEHQEAAGGRGRGAPQANVHQSRTGDRNPDSQTDTALHHAMPSSSGVDTTTNAAHVPFHRYDPTLPPVSDQRTTRLHFTSRDANIRVNDDTVIAAWTAAHCGRVRTMERWNGGAIRSPAPPFIRSTLLQCTIVANTFGVPT